MKTTPLHFFIFLTTLVFSLNSFGSEQSASAADVPFSFDSEVASFSLNGGENIGGFVTPTSPSPTASPPLVASPSPIVAFVSSSRMTSRRKHRSVIRHGSKKINAEDVSAVAALQFHSSAAAAAPAPLPSNNPFIFDFSEPFSSGASFDLVVSFKPQPEKPTVVPRKILSTHRYRKEKEKEKELKALQLQNKQNYEAWKKENDERYKKAEAVRKSKVLMHMR